jgi:serine protease Do
MESGAISSLDDVRRAVARVDATGLDFEDPETGEPIPGTGTAFIIAEEGIAVTNNHVVTGAQSIKVQIDGETDTRSAAVLGVSECNDLAVLDIDGGGFPHLDWYSEEVRTGLRVYTLGFPGFDEEEVAEARLTEGVIAKTDATGDTEWTSVDATLEHTAPLLPGNSGGPLFDENGKVVGINFAGREDTGQYLAIASSEVLEVIEQLRQGNDVYTLGINGVAVAFDQEMPQDLPGGIFVEGVDPGSAADEAGVEPDDLIVELQGGDVASDGTMATYCDTLRSNPNPDDVIEIVVYRPNDPSDLDAGGQFLEGQINGDPLPSEEAQTGTTGSGESGPGTTGSGYTTLSDNTGTIKVEVPAGWSEVNGNSGPIFEEEGIEAGPVLTASPDIDAFRTSYEAPGLYFTASSSVLQRYDENAVLDRFDRSGDCKPAGTRQDYDRGDYTGRIMFWTDCGGVESRKALDLAAVPEDQSFLVYIHVKTVGEADVEAAERILNTFTVEGSKV